MRLANQGARIPPSGDPNAECSSKPCAHHRQIGLDREESRSEIIGQGGDASFALEIREERKLDIFSLDPQLSRDLGDDRLAGERTRCSRAESGPARLTGWNGCRRVVATERLQKGRDEVLPSFDFRRNLNSPRATKSRAGCSGLG